MTAVCIQQPLPKYDSSHVFKLCQPICEQMCASSSTPCNGTTTRNDQALFPTAAAPLYARHLFLTCCITQSSHGRQCDIAVAAWDTQPTMLEVGRTSITRRAKLVSQLTLCFYIDSTCAIQNMRTYTGRRTVCNSQQISNSLGPTPTDCAMHSHSFCGQSAM